MYFRKLLLITSVKVMDIFDKAINYLQRVSELEGDFLFLDSIPDLTPEEKDIDSPKLKSYTPDSEKFQLKNEQVKTEKVTAEWQKASSLQELYNQIHECRNCPLGNTRTKFVFGAGSPNADIMIIGEAPGRDEDMQGIPFIGRAGQLLTKILAAINLSREEVFIGNIIKCRPPNNRRPQENEVAECEPYLMKQIELINPKFILALGLTAVDTLLKKKHRMADIRGEFMDYHGRQMMVTYHPAALLRNNNLKRPVWEDVKKLRRHYDEFLKE